MKNYSTMNTMQCFSSTNSLSNSSKDSKQMFLTTRREPLIPPSTYQHHLNLQNQSVNYSNNQQHQNYPCVRPHHTVLSSSCSPSISSNSINVWTTINNASGIKQNDKVPHYSALTTLGRLNNHNNLHGNSIHNKSDDSHKNIRWRANERKFCLLLVVIGCILTFIMLIFSLIFYFIVYKQGISFGIDIGHNNTSNSNLVNKLPSILNKPPNIVDHPPFAASSPMFINDKIRQPEQQPKKKRRRRLQNKIEGEMRISNKMYKTKNHEIETASIRDNLNHFITRTLNLCLNNTEITQYRKGENHDLQGIIVNFVLTFNCALPNLAKRLAFSLRDSFKSEYVDLRTLRLTPVFDTNHVDYIEVLESDSDHWLKFARNSEWGQWSDWSTCDCRQGLVVKSRQRTCLNKTTNKSAFSFSCGNSDEESDEHLPSVEIRNCDCANQQQSSIDSNQQPTIDTNLHLTICSKCEKNNEICLSYNAHMPNCLKILNYDDRCGGHCSSKGTECKFLRDKNMFQCLHLNETSSSGDGNLCLDDEFRCADGLCIPNIKRCDGATNCFDFSDEQNCQCDIESGEYMHCGNLTSCIHINKQCDGFEDCHDGFDEKGCFSNCPAEDEPNTNFFHCLSGNKECIAIEKQCDSRRDCIDGSDEIIESCSNKPVGRSRTN